jgi:hypothetical protein
MLDRTKSYWAVSGNTVFNIHPSKKFRGCWWAVKIDSGVIENHNRPLTDAGIKIWIYRYTPQSLQWSEKTWDGCDHQECSEQTRVGQTHGGNRLNFVYFIEAEQVNRIKIGICNGLADSRLAALQCGSPVKLNLLLQISGGRKMEKRLHRKFSKFSSHGEWFDFSDSIRDFISKQLCKTN